MMKKNYITPCIVMTTVRLDSLLTTASSGDITHGGTDYGTHEADSRRSTIWDDEDYEDDE